MARSLSLLPVVLSIALCIASSLARAATGDTVADAVLGAADFTSIGTSPATDRNFLEPNFVAEDPISGELWVADQSYNRVLRFASSRAFANGEPANLVLGQPDFTSFFTNRGGAPAANTLSAPAGLAVDAGQRLHVADRGNQRILTFVPPFSNGMDASAVRGQAGFTTRDSNRGGGVSALGLNEPRGIAVDAKGRLWVADSGNARVIRYGPGVEGASVVDKVLGQFNFTNRISVLNEFGMSMPVAIAMGPDGTLWVVDRGFARVTKFADPDSTPSGAPAIRVLCQPDFTRVLVDPPGVVGDSLCRSPTGVAVNPVTDSTTVYVSDGARVLLFPLAGSSGSPAATAVGQATVTTNFCNRSATRASPAANTLCGATGILIDRAGNLIVVDTDNRRVLRFDAPQPRTTPSIAAVGPEEVAAGVGDFDLTVDGAHFHDNTVVLWNAQALPTRYVSGTRVVARVPGERIAQAGAATVSVTTPPPGGGAAVGTVTVTIYERRAGDGQPDRVLGQIGRGRAQLENERAGGAVIGGTGAAQLGPSLDAVAIDAGTGRVFVADEGAARVLSWPSLATFQNGAMADVVLGQRDMFGTACAAVPGAASMCAPKGLAVDEAGRLYVADKAWNRVLRFDPPFATGMAAVRVFGQGGSFGTVVANLGGAPSADGLSAPVSVAARGGKLAVLDSGNNRVLVHENPDAGTTADVVLGQPNMASALRLAAGTTTLNVVPGGALAFDPQGRLFVSDRGNNRIVGYNRPFANGLFAQFLFGQPAFGVTGSGAGAQRLNDPAAIAFDAEGNLLVSDSGNNRVLRFDAPIQSIVRAQAGEAFAAGAVLGQPDFLASGSRTDAMRLQTPGGIAVDASGNVLVASGVDRRVQSYDRPFGAESNKRLVNIATRMQVLAGEDVMIGGFVIGGTQPKQVVVRARGPSLASFGIANVLANPVLQLFSGQASIGANDNWREAANATAIQQSGFAPAHDLESAMLVTLAPGGYTAIVSGAGGGTGVGIVEVFEVDAQVSPLVNVATRGRVLNGDDVMIGGFVIQGDSPQTVLVRARGPSLAAFGVAGALANPQLQLFASASGPTVIAANDDWQASAQAAAIRASGFAPSDAREAAILVTLPPGGYTAVVSGVGRTAGVAIVEVFVP